MQLTLEDSLNWTLFYEPRPFTIEDVIREIQQLSTPFSDTLELVKAIRNSGRYMLATINNESRELKEYRIQRFELCNLFTAFFTSCYLGLVKPQPEHYRRAMQITQRSPG
jgi:putative hydrolase of the HAD superfamily